MDCFQRFQQGCGACCCGCCPEDNCWCCYSQRKGCRNVSVVLLFICFIALVNGLVTPSQLAQQKQQYIDRVSKFMDCYSYCGYNYSTLNTTSGLCCSSNYRECFSKTTCYIDSIDKYNNDIIGLKILAGLSGSYIASFIVYLVCKHKCRKRRLQRQFRQYEPYENLLGRGREEPHRQTIIRDGDERYDQQLAMILARLQMNPPPAQNDPLRQSIQYRDTQNMCSICLQTFDGVKKAVVLRCDHIFHNDCIRSWAQRHNTCPLCRGAT